MCLELQFNESQLLGHICYGMAYVTVDELIVSLKLELPLLNYIVHKIKSVLGALVY